MAKGSRGPSMHDVAARAGVSHQTVSRVLNDFPGIRPETREKVLEAIRELGYRRNMAARALATGRSEVIGVIMPEVPHFGPTSTLYAIEHAAKRAGFKPLVTTASWDAESMGQALDFLLARSVDALVVMAQHPAMLDAVDETTDVPVLFALTGNSHGERSVAVDQVAGTRLALDHLYELGHRRFQHITGITGLTEAQLRRDTFTAFLDEHALEHLPILEGDWSADAGYRAGLAVEEGVTALFCANDPMAVGAIHALEERGLEVPRDISVVGFDDVPEAAYSHPGLTTVHQDFTEVGLRAVALLIGAMNGEPPSAPAPVEPWLVVRASTGPAPA
ncbi:LacI family DNA-binding transcriptional regulator [Demequina lignilytica]|uniref:LacI family DNA-binding transcriptional regulator n=1 Tax=Demequina lignilytica TaxID=3051663 RepID=A0AB35MHJ2_9MICO|nr:LacI family DNA-binding transcriptional regulator [Demequina sp. SYSU T0a273]MDN4483244.1 LacI family DNA-binding transcriptional regulator [Demequina sp. SYSU T0a273]